MTQSPEIAQQALAYARHQAAKSLADLAALMERTGADCGRCLEGVSEAQASFSHGEEWSMKEVVGHMLGSGEAINHEIAGLAAGRESRSPGRTGITAGGDQGDKGDDYGKTEGREGRGRRGSDCCHASLFVGGRFHR